ncbi:MAG: polysulfide reductase NrfD [Actinomycetota bacterium]|nr:polysulfide reductase NrfD [Actinomycetota bacterium]
MGTNDKNTMGDGFPVQQEYQGLDGRANVASTNGAGKDAWEEVVREAAVRSMRRHGRKWWTGVVLLTLVVLAGFYAWIYQLRHGMGSAGYNDTAFWAVYLADVVAFIGVSYGGAVISAILRLTGQSWRAPLTRLAEGMALVTVLIGAAFIFPHLGRPERFLNIIAYPNTSSPLVWDFLAISTYMLATVIFFYLPLIPDLAIVNKYAGAPGGRARKAIFRALSLGWLGNEKQRRLLHGALTIVSLLIVPLAVSVHSVLSWAFALTSRPGWAETVFPPYFVIAALYSGTALVVVTASAFRKGYHLERFITRRHFARLGYLMAALGLVYLYLTFVDLIGEGYTGITTGWIQQTVTGRYALAFWFYVVAGELLPIVLVAIKKTRTPAGMTAAAVGVVIALWVKRMVIILPPATQPLVSGPWGGYHFTWVSITITLAGVAAIPLLMMLLFHFIPLFSIDEMEEVGYLGAVEQISAETTAAIASGEYEKVPALLATGAASQAAPGSSVRRTRPHLRRRAFGTGAAMVGAALLAAGAISLFSGARPAGASTATPFSLVVTQVTPGKAPLALTASGSPGQKVDFYVKTTTFSTDGMMQIGSAVASNGVAEVTYLPTWTGEETFVAQALGAGGTVAGSATQTYKVTIDPAGLPKSVYEYTRPMDGVGVNLVRTLLGIAAAVWILLLGTLVLVAVRMPRMARR